MTRRWLAAALAAGTLLGAAVVVARAAHGAPCDAAAGVGKLKITAPAAIQAGTPLAVTVRSAGPFDQDPRAVVALVGPHGPRTRLADLRGGTTTVHFDARETAAAGVGRIEARSCAGVATAAIRIEPGPAAEPVSALVGPKRVVADGRDWTLVLAIPRDRFGNALGEPASVTFLVQGPAGEPVETAVPVRDLVAWLRIPAGTTAGRFLAAARVGSTLGPRAEALATAGLPEPGFAITVEASPDGGPGSNLVRVTDLVDRHGNRVPDGTLVTLVVTDADGSRRILLGTIIDGSAKIEVQPSTTAGTMRLQLVVRGVASRPVELDVDGDGGTAPASARYEPSSAAIRVSIGPVLDPFGAYAPDGTSVDVTVTGPATFASVRTLRLRGGLAVVDIPVPPGAPGAYTVVVRAAGASMSTEVTVQ